MGLVSTRLGQGIENLVALGIASRAAEIHTRAAPFFLWSG
jgi:hypothetical protein